MRIKLKTSKQIPFSIGFYFKNIAIGIGIASFRKWKSKDYKTAWYIFSFSRSEFNPKSWQLTIIGLSIAKTNNLPYYE